MSNNITANDYRSMSTPLSRQNAERTMQFLENHNLKAIDADTFEHIKDLIDKVEVDPNSKFQGPLKTVLTALSLAGASALTAAAVTGRGLSFLQKNTKIVDKVGKYIMDMLTAAKKYLKKNPTLKEKSFKGYMLRLFNKTITWIENISKKGIEDITKNIKGKGSVNKKLVEQGKNIVNKTAKTAAAVGVGGKTLKETTEDANNNGIADIQETQDGKSSSIGKQLASAIIESAI